MKENRLKILIVTCIYPEPAAEHVGTFVANWAEQLKATGLNIQVYKRDHITFGSYISSPSRVLKFYNSPRVYNYEWNGISVCRQGIHLRLPLDYSKSAPQVTYRKIKPIIADIYKDFPFDLIYLATWGDLSLAMSWVAKEMNIPFIASAIGDHTTQFFDKPGSLYYNLERETYICSEFVICVSHDMRKKVEVMTDGNANAITFYSGVDTEKFKPSPNIRNDYRKRLGYGVQDIVLLFVGRVTKEKGIFELVEAFAQVSKNNPQLKLLLVGPLFEKKNLEKSIRNLGVNDQVELAGSISHDEIPKYMNLADLFVFPSWMEGLPNVVMEAASCGLPVVASKVGGIPELIDDNVTGFMVPPNSPKELVEKLSSAFSKFEKTKVAGQKAREKMIREFNYHKNGRILSEKIQSIVMHSN